ncbi:BON domain-containing protein [Puniceicoccaceae bacterium K14]|nr:BON domain-containing protein [Puniceicoccaceae bacterium K14]
MSLGIYKSKDDRLIERVIKQTYNFRIFFGDYIKVISRDGIVTFTGRVSGKYEKDLSSRTATSFVSVLGVKNKLIISDPRPKESDDALLIKCRKRLAVIAMINMRSISLSVRKGRITLEGVVDSLEIKDLVEIRLREIEGVESVENKAMRQVNTHPLATVRDQIDDISITGLIKLELLQDPMTKTLSLSIDTFDGNVTIIGQAVVMRQIQKVSEIASLFVGVRAVSNKMTTDPAFEGKSGKSIGQNG